MLVISLVHLHFYKKPLDESLSLEEILGYHDKWVTIVSLFSNKTKEKHEIQANTSVDFNGISGWRGLPSPYFQGCLFTLYLLWDIILFMASLWYSAHYGLKRIYSRLDNYLFFILFLIFFWGGGGDKRRDFVWCFRFRGLPFSFRRTSYLSLFQLIFFHRFKKRYLSNVGPWTFKSYAAWDPVPQASVLLLRVPSLSSCILFWP